jgi:hypothetical protein
VVQVDPFKPTLKAPGTKRLKLKCDLLLLTFAFKFKLRRYITVFYSCSAPDACARLHIVEASYYDVALVALGIGVLVLFVTVRQGSCILAGGSLYTSSRPTLTVLPLLLLLFLRHLLLLLLLIGVIENNHSTDVELTSRFRASI